MKPTTLIITSLLLPALAGCYSLSGHSTIARTKSLCDEEFTYTIIQPLNLPKGKKPIFLADSAKLWPWMESETVVRYRTVSKQYIQGDASADLSLVKIVAELYVEGSDELVATMTGFSSKTPRLFPLADGPSGFSCGIFDPSFIKDLVVPK